MPAIRDMREAKNLSQLTVARAAGLSESAYQRIEAGSARTTKEEISLVTKTIRSLPKGTRRVTGRPFKDPDLRAAVEAAREAGESVAAVLAPEEDLIGEPEPAPAKKSPRKSRAKGAAA